MARWKKVEVDINQLIPQITGFQNEREENFQLCSQYALSNIKYHRYLDVDGHKVTKSLSGVIEKFAVHSQQEKSEALKNLTDEFLNAPVFEHKNAGKTDTHYRILSLLLCLADSPTHSKYEETPVNIVQEEEDRFDWTGYLLDGEDTLTIQDLDIEDDESDQESDEQSEDGKTEEQPTFQPHEEITLSTIPSDGSTLVAVDDITLGETGFDWLMKNVVLQYWCGQSQDTHTQSSNLNVDWECYKRRTEPLYTTQEKTVVTEIQLIREILWMLSGVSDLFVFIYNGQRFIIRENVIISNLTDESLYDYLENFTKYGAYVVNLQKFIKKITGSCITNTQGITICQTYEAFSRTLSLFLENFKKELTELEKNIISQQNTVTLMTLHLSLESWLKKVDVVHSVYSNGICDAEMLKSNCQKASHLLTTLYDTVMEYDDMGQFGREIVELLLPMWIETIRPYIDIIDEWITNGTLVDPKAEFILKRDENVKSLDEDFWEKTFTTHIPANENDQNQSSLGDGSVISSSKAKSRQYQSWAPEFLQPVLIEVVLAGKSMEMLKDMGKLKEVVGGKGQIYYRCTPLFNQFLRTLENILGYSQTESTIQRREQVDNRSFSREIEHQMKIKGIYDPLLKINIDTVFTKSLVKLDQDGKEKNGERLVKMLKQDRLKPIDVLVQECLYPHIHEKYSNVCCKLVEIMKEEYELLQYLASMRYFFLMEAGDAMFCFYSEIFDKIRLCEQWRDVSIVNMILDEALQTHFPDELHELSVDVVSLGKDRNPINATDCLKLYYKVPWPVDIVITSKCQEIYNQIFCFLLQIKRAKYCLDELRFFDLEKENILRSLSGGEDSLMSQLNDDMPRRTRVHRMHIMKMRLTYFVNSLHNYIMTRILHSTGLEFKQEMEKATDLDQIIDIHGSYVSKIHERCLLHKKVTFLKEAVMKVLNLILIFQKRWDMGIDEISLKVIEDMEMEFSRCIQFLASFLNNVIKRGSFPHLESLAFALVTSTEHLTKT